MIGIRADANLTVATGHVMRCITIAKEIEKLGESVIFYTADHCADDLIASNLPGCRHIVLDSDWENMEDELPVLCESIQSLGIDILLIDSYRATYDYLKALNRIVKTAYIDDVHEGVFPVDLLVNYNGYHTIFDYELEYEHIHGKLNVPTKLLLGLKYVPLREQFRDISQYFSSDKNESNRKISVLLSSGGGDRLRVMSGVLNYTSTTNFFNKFEWHVIMGSFTENEDELLALANKHDNIILHKRVEKMAELMCSCDIAITAAGTMINECAATKLPTIYYMSASNQRYDVDYWQQNDMMLYAGDITSNYDHTISTIVEKAVYLLDANVRNSMSKNLSNLIDGKGAERIAKELFDYSRN